MKKRNGTNHNKLKVKSGFPTVLQDSPSSSARVNLVKARQLASRHVVCSDHHSHYLATAGPLTFRTGDCEENVLRRIKIDNIRLRRLIYNLCFVKPF